MTNVPVLPCFRIAVPVCETGSSHGRAWATALSRDRARRYRLLPGATRDVRQAVQPVHLWSSWNGEDGLLELRASRTQGELWQQVAERLCNRRILWNTVGRSRNPPRHLSCRANTICFYHVIIHFSYSVSISPSRILRSQNFTQNQGNSAVFGGVCDFFQIAAGCVTWPHHDAHSDPFDSSAPNMFSNKRHCERPCETLSCDCGFAYLSRFPHNKAHKTKLRSKFERFWPEQSREKSCTY